MQNRQVVLNSRPCGELRRDNFSVVKAPVPNIVDGEMLVRNHLLSIDPYMRGRMDEAESYAPPVPLGSVMVGQTVGEVVASRLPGVPIGAFMFGRGGWQDYSVFREGEATAIDPAIGLAPWLGPLGLAGCTAHVGLYQFGAPVAGETIVVSSASGAVGGIVGQLAKSLGLRVIGIAGGAEKCRYAIEELGYDVCIDHRASDLVEQLAGACPNGIDIDFENVGGRVFEAVWQLLNVHARVIVCGLIAEYNNIDPPQRYCMQRILKRRLRVQGFIVSEHQESVARATRELRGLLSSGALRWRQHVTIGLEQAPDALIDVLAGRNFGKAIVEITPGVRSTEP